MPFLAGDVVATMGSYEIPARSKYYTETGAVAYDTESVWDIYGFLGLSAFR